MAESAKKQTEAKKSKDYYNELVTVNLFKDNDKYSGDIFVAVNGVGMMVPRGRDVKIPRKYAEVLKNSMEQDKHAAEYIDGLTKNAGAKELN